jgi:hypothetical protein
MQEREPRKETIGQGQLFFLNHPGTESVFSGYGLTTRPDDNTLLIGLLMVDRPQRVDPLWLEEVEATFGEYQLVAMTASGARGIACQMQVEPDSIPHLRQYPGAKAAAIGAALKPLLDEPPIPTFVVRWDEEAGLWRSEFAPPAQELPGEIRAAFENAGYECLAAETNIGVVHVCHASDADIAGFAGKPVLYQWQLIEMPTAPLIRLDVVILDQSASPYKFESFLNVAAEDQVRVLSQLANQDRLYLAFYGNDMTHRFTKLVTHDRQQWQYLDELVERATRYWQQLPPDQQDFDRAKAEFMSEFV